MIEFLHIFPLVILSLALLRFGQMQFAGTPFGGALAWLD